MRLDRPEEERFAAEDGVAPGLAVAAPELFPRADPRERAADEAPKDGSQRRIEPDDRVGLFEDDVTELAAVVAVDDPPVARDRAVDARPEVLGRGLAPVRSPVERVELDVRDAEPVGEPAGERRLARARRSDDSDPGSYGAGFSTLSIWARWSLPE